MPENARVLLKIHGKVQGVFFRAETKKKADSLSLAGWVKNAADSTVECLAEGEKEKLQQLIDWCYEGSEAAKVDKIDINWQLYQAEFKEFSIMY